ncbi:MAG: serine/threonine-protein kinase [Myxococcota bacterium]
MSDDAMVMGAPRAYRVLGVAGKGGFATVYRAELVGPGGFVRPVALKLSNPEFEHHTEFSQRLRDEARILGMVRHRAIVQVEELALLDGHWAVVMEWVDGADLEWVLARSRPPASVTVELTAEIAGALAAAHSATGPDGASLGLVHRDLKPGNVLVTRSGEVKVVDFGVARGAFAAREALTAEFAFGSPNYMAPERLDGLPGEADTAAGDVYGLGVVAYEALLGVRFGKAKPNPRKHAARVEQARRELLAGRVSLELTELVVEMLGFGPEGRPSAAEVERRARDLRRGMDGPWLSEWLAVTPIAARRPLPDVDGALASRLQPVSTTWTPLPVRRRSLFEAETVRMEEPPEPPPRLPPAPRARPDLRWAALALAPVPFAAAGAVVAAAAWWLV